MKVVDRVNVLGVKISVLNLELAISEILNASKRTSHLSYVTVTGVHGVVESQGDKELKKIHNNSFLSTPDGMPMVWFGKYVYGKKEMNRVYGPELMEEIFRETEGSEIKHFFYGGDLGVAEELRFSLMRKFPKTNIAGTYTPPFRELNEDEESDLMNQLMEAKPHLIWVGLSTPKQERFMHSFIKKHPALNQHWEHGTTFLGVGAAFDFLSYRVKQAPYWIQRSGFEWLYRAFKEPKRLLKRYIVTNTLFCWYLVKRLFGMGETK